MAALPSYYPQNLTKYVIARVCGVDALPLQP